MAPYSESEYDASQSMISYSDSDSESVESIVVADAQDSDLAVFRQSANFMLKLSEMIYNHALELSVKRSVENFTNDFTNFTPGTVIVTSILFYYRRF